MTYEKPWRDETLTSTIAFGTKNTSIVFMFTYNAHT